ncbi:MAG TPA: nitroreductase/quinone reductase family protein [Myxococcota bacterium]|nr:nitroreductase/quinone reductase family protein [Myxococcota bacterium]
MSPDPTAFERPSSVEFLFNRAVGFFLGLGIGFRHNYLLQVRGRTSGKLYSTPVDVLSLGSSRYLVAPRGNTQWVRNALAAGRVILKKGMRRTEFEVRTIPDAQKPELLKAYLDQFKLSVGRFFPIPAGSPAAAFAPLASQYPVFELVATR